jgi:hypothetical protein
MDSDKINGIFLTHFFSHFAEMQSGILLDAFSDKTYCFLLHDIDV